MGFVLIEQLQGVLGAPDDLELGIDKGLRLGCMVQGLGVQLHRAPVQSKPNRFRVYRRILVYLVIYDSG